MRVRCRAAADYRSNAIGNMELEVTPSGLSISYLAVSRHREGHAPGPFSRGAQVLVPWPSVYATRTGDEHLLLSVDGRVTPLNRFFLGDFSRGEGTSGASQRRRTRALQAVAAAASLILACLLLPELLPNAGASTAIVITGSAALLILLIGVSAEQWVAPAPPSARAVLDELCQELSRHLPGQVAVEIPKRPGRSFGIAQLQALLPRSVIGIAITLSATSLAALVAISATTPWRSTPSQRLLAPREPPQPAPETAALRLTVTPEPQRPVETADDRRIPDIVPSGACRCLRHDSPLWRNPLPRLSPLVISRQDRPHGTHNQIDLELAAVNNGDRGLQELNVAVSFYEMAGGRKRQTVVRPLYYEGPLAPGRAVRWKLDGRGTGFDVLAPDLGALDEDGSGSAPADSLARLAAAHYRPVRMHAAMLLAYRGDARAPKAATDLRAADREDESSYLERVLDATRALAVCKTAFSALGERRYRVQGCVHNRAQDENARLALRIRWLAGSVQPTDPRAEPPIVLGEHVRRIAGAIPRGEGREIELTAELEGDVQHDVRGLELVADRAELLE